MSENSSKANAQQASIVHKFVHDLKNKIGGLALLADMFNEQDPAMQAEIIAQFKKGTMEALRASEVLMDDLGIERELTIADPQLIDLSELVQHSAEKATSAAQKKNISIITDITADLKVYGQQDLLARIPDQLIGNAIKFCGSGAQVKVVLTENEDACALKVIDDGPGIPKKEISELFKRYVSLSNEPTGGESSSKRGLADAQLIAKAHGATLTATSGGKGCGSSFELEIPKAGPKP